MINNIPTYKELENQIVELENQIKFLRQNSALQNKEKEKRANELNIANVELEFQSLEKEKRAAELIIANVELASQKEIKNKRAAELIIANVELAFQKAEKRKRAAELVIANVELAFQKEEKGKRASELIIANIEVALQSQEKEKLASELIIATLALGLQADLIIAKEKAEESDRLKTAFLQNMSHEIRTPMNAIIGFSNMLEDPDLSPEKRKSFILIIINSTYQLLSIVTDVLTISSLETKQETLNIGKVCVNSVIVELLAIFKSKAFNQNISLFAKQQLTNQQSEIYTDSTKLTQILTNLITNSLKFTHKGFIEFGYNLSTSIVPFELEFYVKDSGIGIAEEMHETIFERFRQANLSINDSYGGTGLGLSISKGFVELLGGKIWVESDIGKGSTFYFTIPYKPVFEIEKSQVISKLNENLNTVLVAEDDEYNFLLIEELLIKMDFKLILAKNGQEAIDICHSTPNIALILMDIKMPIMDGYTAAIQIKKIFPHLPIIAQSAYALEHDREKYNETAFDDYITKPINVTKLKQLIAKYIDIS